MNEVLDKTIKVKVDTKMDNWLKSQIKNMTVGNRSRPSVIRLLVAKKMNSGEEVKP